MKHRILSLFAAVVCAVGTVSASWMPSEHYCTFCDNFKFDHAFQFYSAGSQNNGKKTEEMAVQFQECHGVIAFSLMTWDRRMLAQTTNWGMTWVEVYLTGG
ncbi:MAG: hypothetical protein IJ814_06620, partial [Paludibacteraceae bacterium]|nr:hypothetical protein [Paludibacteraceae bacterium]